MQGVKLADLEPVFARIAAETLTTPPPRPATAWADEKFSLGTDAAERGQYRSSRTPYLAAISAAVADPRFRRVVWSCGTQQSKTTLQLITLGQRFDEDPVNALVVFPTKDGGEVLFVPRFDAMLRNVPSLGAKVQLDQGKSRKLSRTIGGCQFRVAWAGSKTALASQPCGLAEVDELDHMDTVAGEGDVLTLVEARGANFPDFTMLVTSSPTAGTVTCSRNEETGLEHWDVADPDDLESAIWREFQRGTRQEWAWPCPECGAYFIPRFKHLKWPEGASPDEALRAAWVECPNCAYHLREGEKTDVQARGRYAGPGQRIHPGGTVEGPLLDRESASFWVSGLCSPWRSFGRCAKDWLAAVEAKDPERMQAVMNTVFGELWSVRGDAPAWDTVAARRLPYRFGEVPEGVVEITAGVDVQADRLYYEIRGWGAGMESWQLEHGELWGNMRVPGQLRAMIAPFFATTRTWAGLPIALMCVDSGYLPEAVYAVARAFAKVHATKGRAKLDDGKYFKPSKVDVSEHGRVYKQGLQLFHVDTDRVKTFVHERLAWPDDQPGGWHLAQDTSDEYCAHLIAEARVALRRGGHKWVMLRKANHYLDCAGLAVAAAYMRQLDKTLLPMRRVTLPPQPPPTAGMPAVPPPQPGRVYLPRVNRNRTRGRFG